MQPKKDPEESKRARRSSHSWHGSARRSLLNARCSLATLCSMMHSGDAHVLILAPGLGPVPRVAGRRCIYSAKNPRRNKSATQKGNPRNPKRTHKNQEKSSSDKNPNRTHKRNPKKQPKRNENHPKEPREVRTPSMALLTAHCSLLVSRLLLSPRRCTREMRLYLHLHRDLDQSPRSPEGGSTISLKFQKEYKSATQNSNPKNPKSNQNNHEKSSSGKDPTRTQKSNPKEQPKRATKNYLGEIKRTKRNLYFPHGSARCFVFVGRSPLYAR